MNAKQSLASLFLGALFGVGLMVSGMMQPQKVQDFLDFTGSWDPSLALVMGGAFLVSALAFPLIVRRKVPLIGHKFHLPTARDLDAKLIVGSALFGIGWGLGGFCPGTSPHVSRLDHALAVTESQVPGRRQTATSASETTHCAVDRDPAL